MRAVHVLVELRHLRWLGFGLGTVFAAACGNDVAPGGCTVQSQDDGRTVVRCDDGTESTIKPATDGVDGRDGISCTLSRDTGATKTLTCSDGTSLTVHDGEDGSDGEPGMGGQDGTSCTVIENDDQSKTISCADGTLVTVRDGVKGMDGLDGRDGQDGASCSVRENDDGSKTFSCADGTLVTVQDGQDGTDGTDGQDGTDGTDGTDGQDGTDGTDGTDGQDGTDGTDGRDGTSCSIRYVGRGISELHCSDGTTATLPTGFRTQLAAGDSHTCLLKRDGSVQCWGADNVGQSSPPAGVRFERIVAQNDASCGIDVEGVLRCWSPNYDARSLPTGQWKEVVLTSDGGCALSAAGQVTCWGNNPWALRRQVPAGSSSLSILAGDHYPFSACVVTPDARPLCWSHEYDGKVFDRGWVYKPGKVVQMARACALYDDGSAACASNAFEAGTHMRKLGVGGTTYGSLCALTTEGLAFCTGTQHPVLEDEDLVDFAAGAHHVCGLRKDDSVVCTTKYAQLDGLRASIPTGEFTRVEVGQSDSACAMRADRSIACFGGLAAVATPEGQFSDLAVGFRAACGVRPDQTFECWGGREGLNIIPASFRGYKASSISMAGELACVVTVVDPTHPSAVLCWGNGWDGTLSFTMRPSSQRTYVDVSVGFNGLVCTLDDAGGADCTRASGGSFSGPSVGVTYSAVWAGYDGICAQRSTGELECGYNYAKGAPERGNFQALSIGHDTGCALGANGYLTCWGKNPYGGEPFVSQSLFSSVSVGEETACGITADRIACWGAENFGQATVPAALR